MRASWSADQSSARPLECQEPRRQLSEHHAISVVQAITMVDAQKRKLVADKLDIRLLFYRYDRVYGVK